MGMISGLTKLGAGKILRIGFYVGIGYLIGKGTFSETPRYHPINQGQVIRYEGDVYRANTGKEGTLTLEKITEEVTKNEDEVILGKRYRAGCSDDHN